MKHPSTNYVVCLLMLVCLQFEGQASAQVETPTAEFKAKLDDLDEQLKALQPRFDAYIANLAGKKTLSEKDVSNSELDQSLEAYAVGMKLAADKAFREAELAAKTAGARGNLGNLEALENLAESHTKTLSSMEKDARPAIKEIKSGTILLDKGLLDQLTPDELDDYRQNLSLEGLQQLEGLYPGLWKKQGFLEFKLFAPSTRYSGLWLDKIRRATEGGLASWFITPAEASLAGGCVVVCSTSLASGVFPPCVACLGAVWPQIEEHWRGFNRCWNGEGRPPWVPIDAWRVICVGGFVAIVG